MNDEAAHVKSSRTCSTTRQPPAGPDPAGPEAGHGRPDPADPPVLPGDGGRVREHRARDSTTGPCSTSPRPRSTSRSRPGSPSVESRHASWLNSLLGESLVPDFAPVEAPIDQTTVLSRVAPFVDDHRSTFPSFDTTVVSDGNNFFVLDFVLFLEYIEAAFYAINVPRFAALK